MTKYPAVIFRQDLRFDPSPACVLGQRELVYPILRDTKAITIAADIAVVLKSSNNEQHLK
jgi:hypothetical protein